MRTSLILPRSWRCHATAAQFLATFVLLLLCLALQFLAPGNAQADSPPSVSEPISVTVGAAPWGQLRLVGQTGGRLAAVAMAPDGSTAYIAEGQRLTTWSIDRTGKTSPAQLASSPLLGDVISEIAPLAVDGRILAAVTARSAGLFIFDLTDPARPVILSHLAAGGSARAVARGQRTEGRGLGWLYVSVEAGKREDNGLWVVDASDPAAPADYGIREQWWYPMDDLAVEGDQLVAVYSYGGYDGGIRSFDVSDPLAPRGLGGIERYYKLKYAYSVALAQAADGSVYAYTADLIVDVTPGAGNAIVHYFLELPQAAPHWTIDRSGTSPRAYTIWSGQLLAFDISDPRAPVGTGIYPINCCDWIGVANGVAVVAEPEGRIEAFDVGRLATLSLVRFENGNYYRDTREIELSGNHALVLHRFGSDRSVLTVLDMRDPAEPRQISEINGDAERFSVSGNDAFLVNEWYVTLLDITDLAKPRTVFTLWNGPFEGQYYLEPRDATSLDHTMYVASVHGLAIYDIQGAPTALKTVATADEARAVKVRNGPVDGRERVILYLAEGPRLHTYDVTVSRFPFELGSITLAGRINDIDVLDGMIYAAVDRYGLQILDVRQPAAPSLLGGTRFATPTYFDPQRGTPCRVRVDTRLTGDGRRLAYLVTNALYVVDVSDPLAPILFAGFPQEFRVQDAEAAWPWVFHSDWWGLRISRIADPPVPPTPLRTAVSLGRVETLAADARVNGRVYTNIAGGPLSAVDVANTVAPRVLGQTAATGNTTADIARQGHVYLWDQDHAGWWYDATNPSAISPGQKFVTSTYSLTLLESGERAWLLAFTGSPYYPLDSRWNGLRLFDIRGGRPVPVDEYSSSVDDLPVTARPAVVPAANGEAILYVTLPEGVLAFNLDAAEPLAHPVRVFDDARWLASDGRYLYRGLEDGWEVYDASGPAPVLLATHRTAYAPSPLQFSAGRGWTSDGAALHVLDLHDLSRPVELAAAPLPKGSGAYWSRPAVVGNRVYDAGGDNGVWIMDYRPPAILLPVIVAQ